MTDECPLSTYRQYVDTMVLWFQEKICKNKELSVLRLEGQVVEQVEIIKYLGADIHHRLLFTCGRALQKGFS
ncbi:hypothetical protein NHX12_010887 [Muraenolepis orangiensis]|uniref:Uncharacterized protein n=1 Tax=Muraenolepis orangiensis TaxID=630683 RepID=A0A9Q0I650_9TELE|nr:hypothetical protein NHX12_010887 [Muraenolepis orangiensis]